MKTLINIDRMRWHKVIEHPGLHGKDIIKQKDKTGFSLHYGKISPGGMIDDPGHNNTEIYFIFNGKGRAKIGLKSSSFISNCVITVKANESHKIKNTGREELHLIAVLAPPFL